MLRAILVALVALVGITSAQAQVTFDSSRLCSYLTLSGGNLTVSGNLAAVQNDNYAPVNAAIPATGAKVYYEFVMGPGYSDGTGTGMNMGLYNGYFYPQPGLFNNKGTSSYSTCYDGFLGFGQDGAYNSVGYFSTGTVLIGANAGNGFGGITSATWGSWKTNGTNIGIAVDTVNHKMWSRINGGNWDNNPTDNPATNVGGIDITPLSAGVSVLTPVITIRNQGAGQITLKAASGSWSFAAPSGFSQLSVPSSLPAQIPSGISGTATKSINSTATAGINCNNGCDGSLAFNFMVDAGSTATSRFPTSPAGFVPGPFCDGVHDDEPALLWLTDSINANYLRTSPTTSVTITMPAGQKCMFLSTPHSITQSGRNAPFGVFTNLTFIATGTTMFSSGGPSGWGAGGFDFSSSSGVGSNGSQVEQDNFSASSAGATCVTMVNSGDEAFYPVGRWVTVAGQGLQIDGFPPNYANWEFAQVSSTPTGQVCFNAPLANAYPTTGVVDLVGPFGNISSTRCVNVTCGGPGRLVRMSPNWGGTIHVIGGTWNWDNEFIWQNRTVINDNMTVNPVTPGTQWCYFWSVSQTVTFNNSSQNNCTVESDKEVSSVVFNNTFINNIQSQSQSVTQLTIQNNSNVSLQGTPITTICNNSEIHGSIFMGNGYGSAPATFTGNNCKIDNSNSCCNFNLSFGVGAGGWDYIGSGQFRQHSLGCNDGACPPPWTSLGGPMHMVGNAGKNTDNELTIGTSFLDGSNHWVFNTSLGGASLPPGVSGVVQAWQQDPYRVWNCTSCTGSPFAIESSMAPAQGAPVNTYINRTYTCSNNVPNVANSIAIENGLSDSPLLFGTWSSNLTINVTTADTNPSDTSPQLFFGVGFLFNASTGNELFWSNTQIFLNLGLTGTRTVTPTGSSGAQSGDTLNSPGAGNNWVENGPSIGTNITNGPAGQCPVFNVTWQTTR